MLAKLEDFGVREEDLDDPDFMTRLVRAKQTELLLDDATKRGEKIRLMKTMTDAYGYGKAGAKETLANLVRRMQDQWQEAQQANTIDVTPEKP